MTASQTRTCQREKVHSSFVINMHQAVSRCIRELAIWLLIRKLCHFHVAYFALFFILSIFKQILQLLGRI